MTLQEYVERFDGAPFDLQEFAEYAGEVTDSTIAKYANQFLVAKKAFENALSASGVELG